MSAERASEHRAVPEPGELVYPPRPSWLPAILAFALALAACGTFASFMVPGQIYAIIGIAVALLVFRGMVRGAIRDHYRLPRKQRVRGAVLPMETIRPPQR